MTYLFCIFIFVYHTFLFILLIVVADAGSVFVGDGTLFLLQNFNLNSKRKVPTTETHIRPMSQVCTMPILIALG